MCPRRPHQCALTIQADGFRPEHRTRRIGRVTAVVLNIVHKLRRHTKDVRNFLLLHPRSFTGSTHPLTEGAPISHY
jgi:hypothetical protein